MIYCTEVAQTLPFFGAFLYFSLTPLLFVYVCALINACSVWCQSSCMNFGAIFHSVLEFLLDPLTIFPLNRLVLYSVFVSFFPPTSLLLSYASSALVLSLLLQ